MYGEKLYGSFLAIIIPEGLRSLREKKDRKKKEQ